MKAKSKPMPSLRSDADAEHFVDSADLSQYDLSGFQPMSFEFEPKSAALTNAPVGTAAGGLEA
ncbi:CopG family antitoxin [Acidithiobacillus ferriphilus]|uniref:CopG family antitoxin n=1 Tax=Acidithiobacillus ferriphilus TaxID=1689834 RepID=UPI001C0779F5|nr:hypothetical protein [Acidithiobacillus ferriphilus]